MSDTTEVRAPKRMYRASVVRRTGVTLVVCCAAALVVQLLVSAWFFGTALVLLVVAPVPGAMLGFMLLDVWSATTVDERGVAVRRLFRVRRTAWRDVLAIEAEGEPATHVTMYAHPGRAIVLPKVDGGRGPSPRDEIHALRATWERHRGADWTPRPGLVEAANARARDDRRTEDALGSAGWAAWTAIRIAVFGVLPAALLAALCVGALDAVLDIPWRAFIWSVVGVAAATFVGVFLRKRRRAR
ncbi:PH domain-containing protein [Streptomyces radicis]|uniref:Low molecular weight protein antigen 6 PH domain-containing protein n=1 Tax=Streptomyces radicis TaxID=1750517 RepID=A0A3A9W1X2_9ACTN|nr:PH domain-containing protein [Streptomyces radicis]RKN06443.1 hypothetical protein D7319_21855 [Streptomyces radicis]RKN20298.1 hypothetical protein D7318_19305 [Streptomyces radicis]